MKCKTIKIIVTGLSLFPLWGPGGLYAQVLTFEEYLNNVKKSNIGYLA